MNENDYLLNLSAVKWEKDYDERGRTIHDKGFRNLDSNYICDVLFMERIKQKAAELGYIHEHTLNTLDVEEYDINHPPYEKLWVYSKTDEPYPESVIGIYRANWYRAEYVTLYSTRSSSFGVHSRYVDEFQYEARETYKKFIGIICGKKEQRNKSYDRFKVRAIVIVIVDEYGESLIHLLQTFHRPYVLFCVIVTDEREKIWIGNDVRRFKDSNDNSYYEKIEELKYLLSD
ncbi:MAG: hypothetical protein IKY26_03335 [Erysipelotrichaceae bacterium]|nr:hypothetical protein [Erysipelotrichaceae bacterium]